MSDVVWKGGITAAPHAVIVYESLGGLTAEMYLNRFNLEKTVSELDWTKKKEGGEFIRNIYAMSGFCIRPKAKIDVYDVIEEMLKAKGYAVDRDLLKRAVSMPHRTVITPDGLEEERRHMLRNAFLEMLKEELRKDLA